MATASRRSRRDIYKIINFIKYSTTLYGWLYIYIWLSVKFCVCNFRAVSFASIFSVFVIRVRRGKRVCLYISVINGRGNKYPIFTIFCRIYHLIVCLSYNKYYNIVILILNVTGCCMLFTTASHLFATVVVAEHFIH